jgi:hypothetical protein
MSPSFIFACFSHLGKCFPIASVISAAIIATVIADNQSFCHNHFALAFFISLPGKPVPLKIGGLPALIILLALLGHLKQAVVFSASIGCRHSNVCPHSGHWYSKIGTSLLLQWQLRPSIVSRIRHTLLFSTPSASTFMLPEAIAMLCFSILIATIAAYLAWIFFSSHHSAPFCGVSS